MYFHQYGSFKSKPILDYFRTPKKRRVFVFCIGAAKTGTTTVAEMFKENYRSAHEPDEAKTIKLVIDRIEQRISLHEIEKALIKRDRRLRLEVESAHPLGYLSDILADIFPTAKFIVTIREPYSWLSSRLNFHYKADPPAWREYREYFWAQKQGGYSSEEDILRQYGLFSLSTYLAQYVDHYARVFDGIPADRRLTVLTHKLGESIDPIAEFVGVDATALQISHGKRAINKINILDEMEPDFVRKIIWQHCGELIAQYFPSTLTHYKP